MNVAGNGRVSRTELTEGAGSGRKRRRRQGSALSTRELEILQLVCAGHSSREIAAALDLSVNTVFVHRANIMNALGVHKASSLVLYAIQQGLVRPDPGAHPLQS